MINIFRVVSNVLSFIEYIRIDPNTKSRVLANALSFMEYIRIGLDSWMALSGSCVQDDTKMLYLMIVAWIVVALEANMIRTCVFNDCCIDLKSFQS